MLFSDRRDAGRKLAERLMGYKGKDAVVIGIPRGGAIVAAEIAEAIGANLDLIIPRKIGAPGNPELAIGAVTADGTLMLDHQLVSALRVPQEHIEKEKAEQMEEIRRRERSYGAGTVPVAGRIVILADDGIATGATVKAAIASLKKAGPKRLILAAPVSSPESADELVGMVDETVILYRPEHFSAVGEFYSDFSQTSDEEVLKALRSPRK